MIRRIPLSLPSEVTNRFLEDMAAFHSEENAIERDEIAARELHALRQRYTGKLRLTDVKEMFAQMKDHV
jgi:putative heme iron utilization protein